MEAPWASPGLGGFLLTRGLVLPCRSALDSTRMPQCEFTKAAVLCSLNQSLKDVLNYGLFQPASNGRDGKFLDGAAAARYPQPMGKGIPSPGGTAYLPTAGAVGSRGGGGGRPPQTPGLTPI